MNTADVKRKKKNSKGPRLPKLQALSDFEVLTTIRSMAKGNRIDRAPRLAEISEKAREMGLQTTNIKTISEALKRLEQKGYVKFPLELAA